MTDERRATSQAAHLHLFPFSIHPSPCLIRSLWGQANQAHAWTATGGNGQ